MTTLNDLMYREYIALSKDGIFDDVINLMHKNRQGVVVIVENRFPIGIITERDLLQLIQRNTPSDTPISELFVTKMLITINKKRSIEYALHVLIDNGVRRLIVVDNAGYFEGILMQDVLVKNLERNAFTTDILITNFISPKKELITLSQNDSIAKAFDTMTSHQVGSVIATNTHGDAVGIITEKDSVYVANNKISKDLPISTVMGTPLITAKANQPVRDVIDILTKNKINRIVIVDEDTAKPINIISMREIAQNLKGNYGQLLECKLKSIKNTLNFIGEYVFEIYEDNGEEVVVWMNARAIEKFGNYFDRNILELINEEKWKEIHGTIKEIGKCKKEKLQVQDMYFELQCSYYFTHKKETLLLVLRDITEFETAIKTEKTKNSTLTYELEILKTVMDHQKTMIFVSNGKEISLANQAFLEFFCLNSLEEFEKKIGKIESRFIPHQNFFTYQLQEKSWIELLLGLYEKDKVVSNIDIQSFEPKVFSNQLTPLATDQENYIITFTDITEEKLESQKYYFNATHDPLTKTYNKSFFLDSLNISLGKTKRYKSIYTLLNHLVL